MAHVVSSDAGMSQTRNSMVPKSGWGLMSHQISRMEVMAFDETSVVISCSNSPQPDSWWGSPAVGRASKGYPDASSSGEVIVGTETLDKESDVQVLHAGTARDGSGRLVTAGGRVLAVTAVGASVADARAKAYEGVASISFPGAQWRHDIAAGR